MRLVVGDLDLSVGLRGDAGVEAAFGQGGSQPVGAVAFVTEQDLGPRQGVEHQGRAFVVAHLSLDEQQDQGPGSAVAHGVKLGIQAALGAPDTSGNSVDVLSRLAAVR